MQERCDELEEEIDDQDAIEDSIRQYKYLLEEYIESRKENEDERK